MTYPLYLKHFTRKLFDLLNICYGTSYITELKNSQDKIYLDHLDLIKRYVHPINYKVIQWKKEPNHANTNNKIIKNKIIEDFMIVEMSKTLDCFDLCRTTNNFYSKTYGIKVVFQNIEKNTMIVNCIVDDIILGCTDNKFIKYKINNCIESKPNDFDFNNPVFTTFINHLNLKIG